MEVTMGGRLGFLPFAKVSTGFFRRNLNRARRLISPQMACL